jgi:1-phosphatidylinositol-3-phosphate 5-kinase
MAKSRLNITRHFSYRLSVVSYSLTAIEDIFELRVPRLQIVGVGGPSASPPFAGQDPTPSQSDEKRVLRREIMSWWQGIAEYMDALVSQALEFVLAHVLSR